MHRLPGSRVALRNRPPSEATRRRFAWMVVATLLAVFPVHAAAQPASPASMETSDGPYASQLMLGVGLPLSASLDDALGALRFGPSIAEFLGDATFLAQAHPVLHLGGRLGGRGRAWSAFDGRLAVAGGLDAMLVAHVRASVGRVLDLGLSVGLGLGLATFGLRDATVWAPTPRAHGGVIVGFRVGAGVRLLCRLAWDWFSAYDLDALGSDLDLGGPSASLGLEARG